MKEYVQSLTFHLTKTVFPEWRPSSINPMNGETPLSDLKKKEKDIVMELLYRNSTEQWELTCAGTEAMIEKYSEPPPVSATAHSACIQRLFVGGVGTGFNLGVESVGQVDGKTVGFCIWSAFKPNTVWFHVRTSLYASELWWHGL